MMIKDVKNLLNFGSKKKKNGGGKSPFELITEISLARSYTKNDN